MRELETGTLTMNADADTWAPKGGKPWIVSRKPPPAPTELFAQNAAVIEVQLHSSGAKRLASAVLRSAGQPSRGMRVWLAQAQNR